MRKTAASLALLFCIGLLSTAASAQAPEEAPQPEAPAPQPEAPAPETRAQKPPEKMDAGTYSVRLRDLEQRVNELKEQIYRSKARLSLLAETVLEGAVVGSQALIVHENKMSSSFRLVKVVVALDGAPIFTKEDDEGRIVDGDELPIFNGSIVPGEHTLTVNLEYRGHGYGMFNYLKGYRFKVRSTYSFTAPEGKGVTVKFIGYEQGGPATPIEERPAVRFTERVEDAARPRGGEARE
jgi:hypothetical protein